MTTELRRFALRRGTAAQWLQANPVLAEGEEGFETDTTFRKIGNGLTVWSALSYQNPGPAGPQGNPGVPGNPGVAGIAGPKGDPGITEADMVLRDSKHFTLTGLAEGTLQLGQCFQGGIRIYKPFEISSIVVGLHLIAEGANAVFEASYTSRLTGVKSILGTVTLTAGLDRTAQLTLSSPISAVNGDSVYLRCTQTGTTSEGDTVTFSIMGSLVTPPALLAAPTPVTGLTATTAPNGQDVNLAWTLPTGTIARSAFHVYKDGSFLISLDRLVTSFVDIGGTDFNSTYAVRAVNNDKASTAVQATYSPSGTIVYGTKFAEGRTSAAANTVRLIVTSVVPAGARTIVHVSAAGQSVPNATAPAWSATDNKGNVYSQDAVGWISGASEQVAILSAPTGTGLAVNDFIDVTCTQNTTRIAANADYISGLTSSPLDPAGVTGGYQATATKNLTGVATATLAQAKEIIVAVFSTLDRTGAAGSLWTYRSTYVTAAGTNERQLHVESLAVSSTAPVTPTMTLDAAGAASAYAFATAAYKGA